jgi:hypothetical protein
MLDAPAARRVTTGSRLFRIVPSGDQSHRTPGDEITHDILTKLNQTFITPFDREDIHALSSQLDDVIDLIDAAASRFVLYRVNVIREGTIDLVKVLVSTAVRWGVMRRIVWAWILTIPGAALIGAGLYHLLAPTLAIAK